MIQAITLGIIGVLVGFGVGSWQAADEVSQPVAQHMNRTQESQHMEVVPEDFVSLRPGVVTLPAESLSEAEIAGLVFMREEEKLARDVYLTLYEQWSEPIFRNIAQSEQTHTEAVRTLLDKYEVTDPVVDDSIGIFQNQELTTLYTELVAQGQASEVAALQVGALIEDLDIKDLDEQLALTDNADITLVYENLQRGSRNHLRAFVRQLAQRSVTYEPSYISPADYAEIIAGESERGAGHMRGWGAAQMGRMRN